MPAAGQMRVRCDPRELAERLGGDAEFQPVQITDDAMDKLAKALGCPVESMTFEPYPG